MYRVFPQFCFGLRFLRCVLSNSCLGETEIESTVSCECFFPDVYRLELKVIQEYSDVLCFNCLIFSKRKNITPMILLRISLFVDCSLVCPGKRPWFRRVWWAPEHGCCTKWVLFRRCVWWWWLWNSCGGRFGTSDYHKSFGGKLCSLSQVLCSFFNGSLLQLI